MSVEYRKGLPTIEQVKAHEERTEFAQWMRRSRPSEDCPVHGGPGFTSLESRFWRYTLGSGIDFDALEYRPASDDGDPMPWPGEPSEGIDSLRRALSIADQRVREQAEEIERIGPVLDLLAPLIGADDRSPADTLRRLIYEARGGLADESFRTRLRSPHLSTRALNVLRSLGVNDIAGLLALSEDQLRATRNCGPATLRRIREAIADLRTEAPQQTTEGKPHAG